MPFKNKNFRIFYYCFEGFSRLGNINNHIRETVSWISKFGHEIHFFNPAITKPVFNTKVKTHLIPVINLPFLKFISFEVLSLFYLFINSIKKHPDLIYFREMNSLVPLIISKIFSVPLIIEVNGWILSELEQTGYPRWKLLYIKIIQRINFSCTDRVIPVSEGLKKLIIQNYPVEPKKVIPVHNGTNPEIFHPISRLKAREAIGLDTEVPIIGFIGSCYHYHGIQYLIEASPNILEKKPDVKFVIAGDGAQLKEWNSLTKRLNVSRSFIFSGAVPFDQAPIYINSYDICIAPWDTDKLKHVGLSPMKLFDYLACEKPVVTSPVYGVTEIFQKYNCGIVIDVKNSKLFAENLLELLNNPVHCKEMSRRGREAILEHFTWEKTSRKIEKVLRDIR